MTKYSIKVLVVLILLISTNPICNAVKDPSKPNLIIVLTDQHNIRTLGSYRKLLSHDQAFVWGDGINVETPHIDSLAKDGALFTNWYASSPICTPSRASFLTGVSCRSSHGQSLLVLHQRIIFHIIFDDIYIYIWI